MDISKLKKFIALSNEDFADAHEPVNDGVKDVPNADDIAREVGRSKEGGGDITSSGPAKVIPEQEEAEEKTEMTEVLEDEAAQKVAPPAAPTEGTAEPTPETEEIEPEEDGSDDTPADEPDLAHDNLKQIDSDEEVTANDKTSIESFLPYVRRSELIGYSKRDKERLTKSIGRLRKKVGVTGEFSISTESINEAIGYADQHLTRLAKKRKFLSHKISIENLQEEVINPLNEQPLAHPGAEPLPVAQGLAITEAELGPVVDTIIEEQAMANTFAQIETLERAGVAVENFTQLLRQNKGRVSKQTAAIIHAALEHIDHTCSLRVRSTGLENYNTTPRAAMEAADIDEKTLGARAGEIGAKILKFLKELWEKAKAIISKVTSGLGQLESKVDQLEDRIKSLKGSPKSEIINLEQTREDMFIGTEFIGTKMTKDEHDVVRDMLVTSSRLVNKAIGPLTAAIKHGDDIGDKIDDIVETLKAGGNMLIEIPGNYVYTREGAIVSLKHESDGTFPQSVEVDALSTGEMKRVVADIRSYLTLIKNADTGKHLENNVQQLMGAINQLRSNSRKEGFDESAFQKNQDRIVNEIVRSFDLSKYSAIISKLAAAVGVRIATLNLICDSYGKAE